MTAFNTPSHVVRARELLEAEDREWDASFDALMDAQEAVRRQGPVCPYGCGRKACTCSTAWRNVARLAGDDWWDD